MPWRRARWGTPDNDAKDGYRDKRRGAALDRELEKAATAKFIHDGRKLMQRVGLQGAASEPDVFSSDPAMVEALPVKFMGAWGSGHSNCDPATPEKGIHVVRPPGGIQPAKVAAEVITPEQASDKKRVRNFVTPGEKPQTPAHQRTPRRPKTISRTAGGQGRTTRQSQRPKPTPTNDDGGRTITIGAMDALLLQAVGSLLSRKRPRAVTPEEAMSYCLSRATRELLPSGG